MVRKIGAMPFRHAAIMAQIEAVLDGEERAALVRARAQGNRISENALIRIGIFRLRLCDGPECGICPLKDCMVREKPAGKAVVG
ncbi:MAG: hypothetical protein ACFB22_01610 [Rhodothalassiaceae bacterium]